MVFAHDFNIFFQFLKSRIGNTNKNRYSSDFSSNGTPQVLPRNLLNSSSPVLASFQNTPIKQDCFDLKLVTNNVLIEKQDNLTLESKRQSADSESTIVTNITTTPQSPELNLSNSDSTLHEDSNLSASLNQVKKTTLSSRVIHKKPSSIVSTESFQPQMEKSVSTSSFQTLLGRRKSSKRQLKSEPKLSSTIEENPKTSFVTYLQNTTKLNKKTKTPSIDLGRSKSKKKWSIITKTPPTSSQLFLDSTAFLAGPSSPKDVDVPSRSIMKSDTLVSINRMDKFLESMVHGGYITPNLYIPMDLW